MSKIAFYIDNSNISDVDVSDVEYGNPGIGGTEHLIFLISSLLAKRDNGLDITLYYRKEQVVPKILRCIEVPSLVDAINDALAKDIDYFILKHDVSYFPALEIPFPKQIKFIIWCHIFMCYWEQDRYLKIPNIHKIVYVGREHRDLYRDHPLFNKSEFIYNCVNLHDCRSLVAENPYNRRNHIVTYIGSLVPYKGFHLLAEAWPDVLKEVPDAQLYVIGNGNVYNSDSRLGELGIADEAYEEYFGRYLKVDNKFLPSVHFMGRMGNEKQDILLKTKVGVPNPSGITETFCLSAVELQSYGARIATIKVPGYIDTVRNGILFKNGKDLAKTIISILKDNDESDGYDKAMEYFKDMFSYDSVIEKWETLLKDKAIAKNKLKNPFYRLKWVKVFIGSVNRLIPLYKFIPPVERVLIFIERKIFNKKTFMDSNLTI